jgi:hypothetical protein
MAGGYSQSTDDLFAPDFFAIRFIPTGQRTDRFNRSKQRQQRAEDRKIPDRKLTSDAQLFLFFCPSFFCQALSLPVYSFE